MTPNNSFKPNLLRYTKAMAEKASHGFGSTTQVGLTQALDLARKDPATVKNILVLVLLAGLAWFGYNKYKASAHPIAATELSGPATSDQPQAGTSAAMFNCDGRTHCSQMTSCAEATYFIQHCPNTKMDGNNDGEPCERQWCN